MARLRALVAVLAIAGCQDEPPATRERPPPGRPATLVALRPLDARYCRASRLLRPICPRRVPAALYPRRGAYLAPHGGPGKRYDRFELIARPRGRGPAHLALFGSRYGLDRVFARAPRVRLGRAAWGNVRGVLVVDEDHLVLRWRSRGVDYALALAEWKPRRDVIATLRAIVQS
jgi:hypothetical protein